MVGNCLVVREMVSGVIVGSYLVFGSWIVVGELFDDEGKASSGRVI